jgi:tetratricopeptide (TPR) repeat protein
MKTTFFLLLVACATQIPKDPEEYLAPRLSTVEASAELLETTPKDSPEYPAILMRRCQLLEQEAAVERKRMYDIDERLFDKPPNKAELVESKAQLQTKHEASQQQSLTCYQEVSDYEGYERRDEALYVIGYLLQEQEKTAEAKATRELLLREFPQSSFAPAALLSLADEAFNNNDVLRALELYRKIEAFPASREYSFALYKKGWCLYNLSNFKEAMLTFVKVVQHTQASGETRIEQEARKDISRVYTNIGTPGEAKSFFLSLKDPAQVPTMLKDLALIYYRTGKYKDYRELCQLNTDAYSEIKDTCDQTIPQAPLR